MADGAPIDLLLIGHRDTLLKAKEVALESGWLYGGEHNAKDPNAPFAITRNGVSLPVWVVNSASFWEPRSDDEWAILLSTKRKLTDAERNEARAIAVDFAAAFGSDSVIPFEVVPNSDGSVILWRLEPA